MKWGWWRCPTELHTAGRDWWKKIISVTGKKISASQLPYGEWHILHITQPALSQQRTTGNGGWGITQATECIWNYSVRIVSVCFALLLSVLQTHTYIHTQTNSMPRWVVDKEKRASASRQRQLNVHFEICTFLIIKRCHLNEQTPAMVLS